MLQWWRAKLQRIQRTGKNALRFRSRPQALFATTLYAWAVRRRALPILVTLAGAALIGLLVYGVSAQAPNRTLDQRVALKELPPAPEAARTLPLLSGSGTSTLASLRGKVVVLNFWASWCGPCETEAPLLEHAQNDLEHSNATVLGITYEDDSPDSLRFVRHNRLTYPNLRDNSGSFARSYGTDQLPESFILNRQGRIVALSRGEIDQSFIARAVALARSS